MYDIINLRVKQLTDPKTTRISKWRFENFLNSKAFLVFEKAVNPRYDGL